MIAQPYQLYVERTDRTKNMARYYAMAIEPTLFGDCRLTRRWGRIGARGQEMVHHFEREEDAVQLTQIVPFLVEDMLKANGALTVQSWSARAQAPLAGVLEQ